MRIERKAKKKGKQIPNWKVVSCAFLLLSILVFTLLHYFCSSLQRKLRSMQLPSDKLCNRKIKSQHCSVTYLGFSWEKSAKFGKWKWACVFLETPPVLAGLTQRMMQISLSTDIPPCLLMRTFEPVPTLDWNTAEGYVGQSSTSWNANTFCSFWNNNKIIRKPTL